MHTLHNWGVEDERASYFAVASGYNMLQRPLHKTLVIN